MLEVNFLWVDGPMSLLERLSLVSFRDHGHRVNLYTYGSGYEIRGIRVRDANEILDGGAVFRYGDAAGVGIGSLAGFADLFRYKLLNERGGYWVDTDVVALGQMPEVDTFFARETTGNDSAINNAVLALPAGSTLGTQLFDIASSIPPEQQRWGECGPRLLTSLVRLHGLDHLAFPSESVYPVDCGNALSMVRSDRLRRVRTKTRNSIAIHLWNEMLRRHGVDKNGPFPRSSMINRLAHRHGLHVSTKGD